MECKLATDVIPFAGVNLRIVRRDISGDDAGDTDASPTSNADGDDDDDWVDPNFFDDGYTVAATTGFCRVWEGAEVLTRLLEDDSDVDASLRRRVAGKRVLELGAGVGLCGIAAASAGAHVMCTDLEAVVEGVIYRNIGENTDTFSETGTLTTPSSSSSPPWRMSEHIAGGNGGTCVAQVLDWTQSIDASIEAQRRLGRRRRVLSREDTTGATSWPCIGKDDDDDDDAQCVNDPRDCELVMAAECLWLRELVDPFCETVIDLMRAARERRGIELPCVLSFRDRSSKDTDKDKDKDDEGGESPGGESPLGAFVPVSDVVSAFEAKGCGWRTLHTSPSTEDVGYHVHVFEITPPPVA
jgi:hypothetical protein